MRSFILSVSSDRWLTPIRNAVLAHAGYAVIPSLSAETAMEVLLSRRVSAMVIGQSIPPHQRQRLCLEGRRQGVPAVVLDRNLPGADLALEIHVDPSDGPEAFLDALAAVLAKANLKNLEFEPGHGWPI
jgi:DNA-binding LacI/PurR family transcriptional regulator